MTKMISATSPLTLNGSKVALALDVLTNSSKPMIDVRAVDLISWTRKPTVGARMIETPPAG